MAGNIKVSGLNEGLTSFSGRGGPNLEDCWPEHGSLPQDFSRLLVVKEGEVFLYKQGKEGAGRSFIKNYLSAEGLLDVIANRISSIYNSARVADGYISGRNQGDIATYNTLLSEREQLEQLTREAQEKYASSKLPNHKKQQKQAKENLNRMEYARRHRAYCLQLEKENLETEMKNLPDEDTLAELDKAVTFYENKKKEANEKREELQSLGTQAENYQWATEARRIYRETASAGVTSPKPLTFFGSLAFMAGAIACGALELGWAAAACGAIALVLLIIYFASVKRTLSAAGSSKELKRIKAEFKQLFGRELTDLATLESKVNELQKVYYRAEDLEKNILGLDSEVRQRKNSISSEMRTYSGRDIEADEWHKTVQELKNKLRSLDAKIRDLEREINFLGVRPEDFVKDDPGTRWDQLQYESLENDLRLIEEDIEEENGKLDTLRGRLSQATGLFSASLDELLDKTRKLLDKKETEYNQKTAEILAKISVNQVITELRRREDERISEGLRREELTSPLSAITGRYQAILYEPESDLKLIDKDNNDYPLDDLSTGAREQVFLAMRMGFSQIAMQGQSAFLLLDDAFQHTDWERRPNLVGQIADLTKTGWQVFYFTMDDHVRDLFLQAGKEMGERFSYKNL